MLFDTWSGLLRVLVAGVASYACLVALLRLSGKRTLATMNAFDYVVTVAFGSTFASVLLSADVSIAEGVLALVVLAVLQFVVAWLAVRIRMVRSIVKSTPTLLLRDGVMLDDALTRERVTRGEVRQAVRAQGIGAVEDVAAVVLETDGSFSVVPASGAGSRTALSDATSVPARTAQPIAALGPPRAGKDAGAGERLQDGFQAAPRHGQPLGDVDGRDRAARRMQRDIHHHGDRHRRPALHHHALPSFPSCRAIL